MNHVLEIYFGDTTRKIQLDRHLVYTDPTHSIPYLYAFKVFEHVPIKLLTSSTDWNIINTFSNRNTNTIIDSKVSIYADLAHPTIGNRILIDCKPHSTLDQDNFRGSSDRYPWHRYSGERLTYQIENNITEFSGKFTSYRKFDSNVNFGGWKFFSGDTLLNSLILDKINPKLVSNP